MNIKYYSVLCFTLTMFSCGLDGFGVNRCETTSFTPVKELEEDIVGTWLSCMDTIDSVVPYCEFQRDGTLVLIGRSEGFIPVSGYVRRLEEGESAIWSYEVDGDTLSVFDEDGNVYYDRINVVDITSRSIRFEELGNRWSRTSCSGPSFD